ncbi:S1C family serine protease [Treponema sp. Marseille-Q3903]|uniref:S1C family serine protease n=1 Tax=Treponema sp. Marseille-Q3903 TaxID=2766703 RepID=UPI0016524B9A|nr:trypsin-like peptidase domain-containing protein [Treponema sp. Marseille-Q3903]MBC6712874.1 trypsin-like peptidase domain-containing protein [Treponema sp. Marseille-Q3903]
MKLYSRDQLIKCTLTGIFAAIVVTSIIAYKINKSTNQKSDSVSQTSYSDDEASKTSKVDESVTIQENQPPILPVASDSSYSQTESQNINVYSLCNEAVVNINTKVTAYDWFLEPYVQDGGSGSGSIIDKRGYILTNVHVIQDATKIYVSLFDGTQYEAEVVGQDLDSDLAVIKFNPPSGMTLKTISFGDSGSLKVGQRVIAIGNPFGLERTMTTGIVSGLGRPIQNSNNRIIRNMIQTDAAINPGNSGGPLLDTNGRMIGINTMIKSSSGSSSGVGFAVPSETAVRVVADLIKYGKVQRGKIDATIIQMSSRIAQYSRLDISTGVLVSEVKKGGQAEKGGLKGGSEAAYYGSRRDIIYIGGDVITKIDNISVGTLADYYSALESKKTGDIVTVTVRRNKKDVQLKIQLVES